MRKNQFVCLSLQSLINLKICKERTSSGCPKPTKAFLSPAGTGSCSGSGTRCQQDDLWLCVLGGGWASSHYHGQKRSTAMHGPIRGCPELERHYNACHKVVWMGREAAVKQLGERTIARDLGPGPSSSPLLTS